MLLKLQSHDWAERTWHAWFSSERSERINPQVLRTSVRRENEDQDDFSQWIQVFWRTAFDIRIIRKLDRSSNVFCASSYRGYQRIGENITKGIPDMHEAIDVGLAHWFIIISNLCRGRKHNKYVMLPILDRILDHVFLVWFFFCWLSFLLFVLLCNSVIKN